MDEIRSLDAEVLAVSTDTIAQNRKLSDSSQLDFSLLADPELTAIDAFGLRHSGASIDGSDIARPAVFIIGRDSRIKWSALTDNWRIRVRPSTILEQLQAFD